jgi:membrane protein required for colicin V production
MNGAAWGVADWGIVVILLLSILFGLARGLVKEIFALVIWVAAVILAHTFSHYLEPYLAHLISTPSLCAMAAFAGIFIAVLLLGALINYGINYVVSATSLSLPNRLLGMCFGVARGVFIIIILLIYVPTFAPVKKDAWFQHSLLIPYFVPYEAAVKNTTSAIARWVSGVVAF